VRKNRFRELLDAGQPTLGTHILSCWPTVVELIGHTGQYDYVEFVGEYAPFDLHDLDNLGRAFEVAGLAGMIKIEQSEYMHQGMRAIGSGFQSVLCSDIRTVEDAATAVRAVRAESPATRGLHGVGMRRDVGVVREGGSPAYVKALDEVVVAIMIEKRECLENLDAILSTKGLDMTQFGPADYAMSIGLAGQWSHPEVRRAERTSIETSLKKGLHPRVEIGAPSEAAPYIEMGVKHFCMNSDVGILHDWWRDNGKQLRGVLGGERRG
jgi:2-keto-3-deoxy-L-rhamnonate aldolase RhmA